MRKGKGCLLYVFVFLLFVCLVPLLAVFRSDIPVGVKEKSANNPLLELKNFRYEELLLAQKGVQILGSLGYHFEDRDEISDFKIHKKESAYITTISSKTALRRGDETLMSGGVKYERSDGYKLFTDKTRYYEGRQTLYIDSPFRFEGQKFVAFGDSSVIDMKNKKIAINSVRAKLNY